MASAIIAAGQEGRRKITGLFPLLLPMTAVICGVKSHGRLRADCGLHLPGERRTAALGRRETKGYEEMVNNDVPRS